VLQRVVSFTFGESRVNKLFINSDGECISPHYRARTDFKPPPRPDGDAASVAAETVSEAPPDGANLEIYVDKVLVAPAIKDYCTRKDLMVSKKLVDVKRLGCQCLLCDEEDAASSDPKPVTVESLARRLLERGVKKQPFHKVRTVSLVGEEKISYRQGAPQRVDIRTEKRKNHNVTIIQGLDARCYGYDLPRLADFFKKKFSVAAFLEEQGSAKLIVLGGFFDRDLEEMIPKELEIPPDCVENLAAGRKAEMKQRKK